MNRIGERMDDEIPITQAAYRKSRSTTEHVFAVKNVIERTLNAKNETVYLILLDMSKAFDTIQRKELINNLQQTINADEIYLIKKMLEVSLQVRCGDSLSDTFQTDTGTPQGDSASANIFTYYLAKSLGDRTPAIHDHQYHHQEVRNNEIPDELTEHNYSICTQVEHVNIEMEYADDLSKVTSDYSNMQRYEVEKPIKLKEKGLTVNNEKTERYVINKKHSEWKKCKLLGSLLDTQEDIKRRKSLAITTANSLNHLFSNDKLTIATKMKVIDVYVEPIFLYNSETWVLNKADEQSIDAFQRQIMRKYVFNVKWPNTMSNEIVYQRSKAEPWRKKIVRKRLKWFGKLATLPQDIPANEALRYGLVDFKKPRGKPKTTWISKVKKELSEMNFSWDEARDFSKENPNEWILLVERFARNLL